MRQPSAEKANGNERIQKTLRKVKMSTKNTPKRPVPPSHEIKVTVCREVKIISINQGEESHSNQGEPNGE